MQLVLTIIAVVVIFSVLVLVHELGHFWAAKSAGVKVLEFGIGFPPRLFGKRKGDTLYSINAIPFGGFVKLYGENINDPDVLKSTRSFARKSVWVRTKIIVAGVFMNFVLALVLLTVGFLFGIQPLILNQDDLFKYVESGTVEIRSGLYVEKVKEGSIAAQAGILPGDEIRSVNRAKVDIGSVEVLEKGKVDRDIDIMVRRGNQQKEFHLPMPVSKKDFGLDLNTATYFPHPSVAAVGRENIFEKADIRRGDIFLYINGQPVYSPTEAWTIFSLGESFEIVALRDGQTGTLTLSAPHTPRVGISEVMAGSAAEKSGFISGDLLFGINGVDMMTPEQVQNVIRGSNRGVLEYIIVRDGKRLAVKAQADEKNVLGIALTHLVVPPTGDLVLQQASVLASLTKINDIKLPWNQTFGAAWDEMWRLTKITASSFVGTVKNIFTKFEVPEDVGGPVQIAYYTHTFVQEGFFALLRFTAVLSISLGVINILPIPALDGGRFLFVAIEAVFKKRVNIRLEYLIHSIGFVLLMILILFVTFSDFTKIFS